MIKISEDKFPLKRGDRGPDVALVQEMILAYNDVHGFLSEKEVTAFANGKGHYGPLTEKWTSYLQDKMITGTARQQIVAGEYNHSTDLLLGMKLNVEQSIARESNQVKTAISEAPVAVDPYADYHISTYVVKPGDTLSKIAEKYPDASLKEIYAANEKTIGDNPDMIRVGMKFIIPSDHVNVELAAVQDRPQAVRIENNTIAPSSTPPQEKTNDPSLNIPS